MKLHLSPSHKAKSICLVLIGGVGVPAEIFIPLTTLLDSKLKNHSICTFTFSQNTKTIPLLEKQTIELENVLDELVSTHKIKHLDLWCTSMGAYSTVKAITNPKYNQYLNHTIFFDPADYYLNDHALSVDDEFTWSGYQHYNPISPTLSQTLSTISSNIIINVTHLTVKNHNESGYLEKEYSLRNMSNPRAYPRLSTDMVKQFYKNIPANNRGKYQEIDHLPHAIFRDGDINYNLTTIASQLIEALSK